MPLLLHIHGVRQCLQVTTKSPKIQRFQNHITPKQMRNGTSCKPQISHHGDLKTTTRQADAIETNISRSKQQALFSTPVRGGGGGVGRPETRVFNSELSDGPTADFHTSMGVGGGVLNLPL